MIAPAMARPPSAAISCLVAWLACPPTAVPQSYYDWARAGFSDAARAAGDAAPRCDPDRDGWPNLIEYRLGSDPGDPGSRPQPSFPAADAPLVCCPLPGQGGEAGLRLLVSADLVHWQPATAVSEDGGSLVAALGGMRFVRVQAFALPGSRLDSDGDGLHDLFEEQLAAESPDDGFEGLADLAPLDDFDGDGTPNIDEPGNLRPACCGFPSPPLLDPAVVATAADNATPPPPSVLAVHTPLH